MDLGIPETEVNIIWLMHGYIVKFISASINSLKSFLLIYNFRAVYRILMYFISEESFYWEAQQTDFLKGLYVFAFVYIFDFYGK